MAATKRRIMRLCEGTVEVGTARVRAPALLSLHSHAEGSMRNERTGVHSTVEGPEADQSGVPSAARPGKGRLRARGMNKTERRYAQHLEQQLRAGELLWYRFEGMKFKLADKTFYTPDFALMRTTYEIECHEVKGHWEDDARVKIKVAAEMFPMRFVAVRLKTQREGGGWDIEQF